MSKSGQIQVRIDLETKTAVEAIFDQLGLKPSEAVRLFYRQVQLNQGLPFNVKIPNEETQQAIADIRAGRGLVSHDTMDSFKQSLKE